MSFLVTLSSFFKKQINRTRREKIESCEEHPDLYSDNDFLEISRMSSNELRSEIYSYDEDPDEVLALIKGRLDHKITPLNKINEPLYSINFPALLSNVIDKKIYLDAFNNQQKNNSLSIPLYSVLIVSFITFLFIPSITETTKSTSVKNETNSITKNNNTSETVASLKINDKNDILIEEHNNLKEEYRKLSEKYKTVLAKNGAYKAYTMKQNLDENSLQKTNYYDNSTIVSSLKATMINFDLGGGLLEGEKISDSLTIIKPSKIQGLLNTPEFKTVNYSPPLSLDKPSTSLKNMEITIKLKEGYSLSYITSSYGLSIKNWGGFRELSSVEEGEIFIIKSEGNYVKNISYIEKDGSITNYRVEEDRIVSTSSDMYYIEENLLIEGKVVTSLSEAIKNNEYFENNIQIARMITQEVKSSLSKESTVDFRKIAYEAPFAIEVKVRKNKETRKIISVEKVKVKKLGSFNVASNTSH